MTNSISSPLIVMYAPSVQHPQQPQHQQINSETGNSTSGSISGSSAQGTTNAGSITTPTRDNTEDTNTNVNEVSEISEADFLARVAAFERNEQREAKRANGVMNRFLARERGVYKRPYSPIYFYSFLPVSIILFSPIFYDRHHPIPSIFGRCENLDSIIQPIQPIQPIFWKIKIRSFDHLTVSTNRLPELVPPYPIRINRPARSPK